MFLVCNFLLSVPFIRIHTHIHTTNIHLDEKLHRKSIESARYYIAHFLQIIEQFHFYKFLYTSNISNDESEQYFWPSQQQKNRFLRQNTVNNHFSTKFLAYEQCYKKVNCLCKVMYDILVTHTIQYLLSILLLYFLLLSFITQYT